MTMPVTSMTAVMTTTTTARLTTSQGGKTGPSTAGGHSWRCAAVLAANAAALLSLLWTRRIKWPSRPCLPACLRRRASSRVRPSRAQRRQARPRRKVGPLPPPLRPRAPLQPKPLQALLPPPLMPLLLLTPLQAPVQLMLAQLLQGQALLMRTLLLELPVLRQPLIRRPKPVPSRSSRSCRGALDAPLQLAARPWMRLLTKMMRAITVTATESTMMTTAMSKTAATARAWHVASARRRAHLAGRAPPPPLPRPQLLLRLLPLRLRLQRALQPTARTMRKTSPATGLGQQAQAAQGAGPRRISVSQRS